MLEFTCLFTYGIEEKLSLIKSYANVVVIDGRIRNKAWVVLTRIFILDEKSV